ncbi:MAG: transporter substrate-binding domain-containing protein [Erysipelotrichaceae bacterium]
MKKILLILLSCLLFGCQKIDDNKTPLQKELLTNNKIIIGISPDYPPFELVKPDGEILGFDIDMIRMVVDNFNRNNNLNLGLVFKQMDFGNIAGAIETNQIDIGVSGFSYDPEKKVAFSTFYLESLQVVVVKKDSNIKTLADLENKKIGAGLGTTGYKAALDIKGAKVMNIGDYLYTFEALKTNNIEAVVCDIAVANKYVGDNNFEILKESLVSDNLGIIINTKKKVLLEEINKAIAQFKASSAYEQLRTKWGV